MTSTHDGGQGGIPSAGSPAAPTSPTDPTRAVSVDEVVGRFADLTGHAPEGVWAAPGRVNLIGEHTDYQDGFVMPFALAQRALMAGARRPDDVWRMVTLQGGLLAEVTPAQLVPGMSGWAAYVAGVVWALREAGHDVGGADLVLSSDVPLGAGLSSSAAIECAALAALADPYDLDIEPMTRAVLARRAENAFVGAPTGQLDQAASTLCTAGHALFFDCRSFAHEQVPFDLAAHGLELLVVDTRTPHAHVDGEYAARRASCEAAAALLGVATLREVTDVGAALDRLNDPVLRRRAEHVITENARVLQAAELLRANDFRGLGAAMNASHTSMRDLFEITVPTVDLAVETALAHGALGARMTGGGFGGCIIALLEQGRSEVVADAVERAFRDAAYAVPAHLIAVASAGAHRVH